MKKKRKNRIISLSLLNRTSKTVWTLGVQLRIRRTDPLIKAEHTLRAKQVAPAVIFGGALAKPQLNQLTVRQKIDLGYSVYLHLKRKNDMRVPASLVQALYEATEALDIAHQRDLYGGAMEHAVMKAKEEGFGIVIRAVMSYGLRA